jgi:multidrug resistance efflux pump
VQTRAVADASRATLERVRDGRRARATEVERARADAETRRRELERAEALRAQDLIATRDVDQARTRSEAADALVQSAGGDLGQHGDELRAAEAQLQTDLDAVTAGETLVRQREAAVALERTRLADTVVVASPLTGVVATRHVTLGEPVQENTSLFTIVATDPLKYAGSAPEAPRPRLRPGQAVRLIIDTIGARVFAAEVTRVAPVVDPSTRTLALEARLLNGEACFGRTPRARHRPAPSGHRCRSSPPQPSRMSPGPVRCSS